MTEISVEEYRALMKLPANRPSKYGAIRCEYRGHKFDSKAERDFFPLLELLLANRFIDLILRQVPVHLPAQHGEKGRIYRMDYLVNVRGGENVRSQDVGFRFLDVKGRDTQASAAKRSFASNYLPRPIELVHRLSNGGYDWPR